MRLVVVTPVGPGHETASVDCANSVTRAWRFDRGPFSSMVHQIQDDHAGALGRSKARNIAVAAHPDADWFMFIDADDLAVRFCFQKFCATIRDDPSLEAVFGAIATDRHGVIRENREGITWDDLIRHGAYGTLSMGCFVIGSAARNTPFAEDMDKAEDFEFYLRLLRGRRWAKIRHPLVTIRRSIGSAGGPRGYKTLDWRAECQKQIDRFKASEACRIAH